ncbi:MAG: hypothetical protein M3512_10670 [Bacteroidota bacterium]|nr:hypothetical protein [Bacteroidota bacterium]
MNNFKKGLLGVLVLVIIAIFIYLWLMVALWAIAFIATMAAVALIVFGIYKVRQYFENKKNQRAMVRREPDYINKRTEL